MREQLSLNIAKGWQLIESNILKAYGSKSC
jgi:hypothetical protein